MAEPRLRKLPPGLPEAYLQAFMELTKKAVSFHPAIAHLCGGAQAGLMCCQGMFHNSREQVQENDGWFALSAKQWEKETCLSRREQDTAKAVLKKNGFMETDLRKVNGAPVLHFRMNMLAICGAFMKANTPQSPCTDAANGLHENAKSDCTETPNLFPHSAKSLDCTETPNPLHQNAKSYKEIETLVLEETEKQDSAEPASFPLSGNGHKANASSGLAARLEAIRQSRAEQKPLYRAERLLLPTETDEGLNATEVAWAVCGEMGRRGDADRIAMEGAVVAYRVKFPAKNWEQCAEELMAAWLEYEKTSKGAEFKFGFRGFFDSSHYLKREEWAKGPKQNGVDDNGGYFDGDVYVTKEGKRLPGYVPPPSARRQAQ